MATRRNTVGRHIKLGALMDMLPLVEPSGKRGYAPWREDPRPMGGLLQGVYAFTGIVRFWSAQRRLAAGPDDRLRADVLYERWRLAIELVTRDLLCSGVLTRDGTRFVTMLRERGQQTAAETVPAEAAEIATKVALDNWLTWHLRHQAVDAGVGDRRRRYGQRADGPRAARARSRDFDGQ